MKADGFEYVSEVFSSKHAAHRHACDKYMEWARGNDPAWWFNLYDLSQYEHLSCFCPLDYPCHVDRIIEILEEAERRARLTYG